MTEEKKRLRLSDLQRGKEKERGIACRRCGCRHFRVVYTRQVSGGRILRRRECRHCGKRISTYESQN